MKEKLIVPPSYKGELWIYNKEGFLDRSYQSFLHSHDEIELNLVTAGRGVCILNSRKIEMVPGTILWLFPEQEHLLLEKSTDFEMWILIVKPDYLRELCDDPETQVLLQGDPAGNFCRSLSAARFQKLNGLCRETLLVKHSRPLFNAGLGYLLLSAWDAYRSASAGGPGKPIHPAVDRAARRIVEGMGKENLACLSHEVGLSPNNLSRLFKQQMGLSVTAFRNRCHVEHFLDLYGDGQSRTLLDAALEAGFGSYAQFFRIFKETMGVSPSEYRRAL